ncbi:MAG TPA: hypothetical protein VNM37_25185, partial [Candidatus Dormibacteraeota bacterium]|nr:hypothetical protein [Candidatus Dormibacteraeota bacterium]
VQKSGVKNFLYRVTPWGEGWLAVGDIGTILRSADGGQWTRQALQPPLFLLEVARGGGSLVTAGEFGRIYQTKVR